MSNIESAIESVNQQSWAEQESGKLDTGRLDDLAYLYERCLVGQDIISQATVDASIRVISRFLSASQTEDQIESCLFSLGWTCDYASWQQLPVNQAVILSMIQPFATSAWQEYVSDIRLALESIQNG